MTINESMIDPNPFVPADIISLYHDRATWTDERKQPRPRALSANKTLENLYRAQQLYYDVFDIFDNKLREKYGHDDKLLEQIRNKIRDRIDNKVRSDSQGQLFVQIGKYYYTGTAKEYEKFFNSTKKIFNSVLKEIANELLQVINNKEEKELGKPIKYDSALEDNL